MALVAFHTSHAAGCFSSPALTRTPDPHIPLLAQHVCLLSPTPRNSVSKEETEHPSPKPSPYVSDLSRWPSPVLSGPHVPGPVFALPTLCTYGLTNFVPTSLLSDFGLPPFIFLLYSQNNLSKTWLWPWPKFFWWLPDAITITSLLLHRSTRPSWMNEPLRASADKTNRLGSVLGAG